MLDAKFVRENLDAVAEAMANRNFTAWDSQAFTELDAKRRELRKEPLHHARARRRENKVAPRLH